MMRCGITIPICKSCAGLGHMQGEGLIPRTCEVCDGEGVKLNVLVTALVVILTVATTVLPIGFWVFK